MRRALEPSRVCAGKAGWILPKLVLLIFIFFGFLNSSYSQLPLSTGAPYVGQKAPSFTLPDQHGKPVSLANLLKPAAGARGKTGGLVLIFYRGYW
jgi:cytochrome oxidase Cu insertion factor (SCO1/SenC/PrrC family)